MPEFTVNPETKTITRTTSQGARTWPWSVCGYAGFVERVVQTCGADLLAQVLTEANEYPPLMDNNACLEIEDRALALLEQTVLAGPANRS